MALEKLFTEFLSYFPLKVEANNCVNQDNLKVCNRCEEVCPHGAIKLENNRPVVDFEKCTVCGLCLSECPVRVFDIEIDLTEFYKPKSRLLLGCYLSGRKPDVKVPCLAIFNEEILASFILNGSQEVILDTEKCKSCPQKENYEHIKRYVEGANLLLHYHRVDGQVREISEGEPLDGELDEREFLSSLFGEDEKREKPKVSKKINVPLWRQLFFETVKRLPPENLCYQPVEEERLRFARVVIDDNRCKRSNVCSFWCPTKALSADEKAVYFTQILCTDCGLCEKICPNSAVKLEKRFIPRHNVMAGKVVVGKGEKKVCKKCGREFIGPPEEELCLYCRKDAEMEKLMKEFLFGSGD